MTNNHIKNKDNKIQIKNEAAIFNAPREINLQSLAHNGKKNQPTGAREKVESIEFALPEIQIDQSHKIESFYPYFLKANLLHLNHKNLNANMNGNTSLNPFITHLEYRDFSDVTNLKSKSIVLACVDQMCEVCHINNKKRCLQCLPGSFLLDGKCYTGCPDNFIADIYRRECIPEETRTRNTFSRVTYIKAFSTGSCKNMCGSVLLDCNCQIECRQFGNCCSDYRDCEVLLRNNQNKKEDCENSNPNCEFCVDLNNSNAKCGQCKHGFFLRNGECVQLCAKDDKAMKENMICIKSQRCLVENCEECEEDNPSVCKKCHNGTFLHNNMCHIFCPGVLKADRMNWICMEPSVFSWYWIFPSKSTCRNNCDRTIGAGMDCSCREDCVRYGNCCQDIEEYCYKFIVS